jgi:hypothetical protein
MKQIVSVSFVELLLCEGRGGCSLQLKLEYPLAPIHAVVRMATAAAIFRKYRGRYFSKAASKGPLKGAV